MVGGVDFEALVDEFRRVKQYDQIKQFLKVLDDQYSYKSDPNAWWLLALFKNIIFN